MYIPSGANSAPVSTGTSTPFTSTPVVPLSYTPSPIAVHDEIENLNVNSVIERRIQRELSSAEDYIKYFIMRYIIVWTLTTQNRDMSIDVALLQLPKVKLYLDHESSLKMDQRLNIIQNLVNRMKQVLPNTIQQDHRQYEMDITNRDNLITCLNSLDGIVDTLRPLLPNTGQTGIDSSHTMLDTSDIGSATTVLAAAYVIENQIEMILTKTTVNSGLI